jgi:putative FmdB family regulatory protein
MPTYDFECEACAYYTEITQRHNDPESHECPHCEKNTLVKIYINPPAMFVRGEPTTIGQLADRNTEKMGSYEMSDKKEKDGINKSREGQKKRNMHKKINAMTETQKLKWIHNGD